MFREWKLEVVVLADVGASHRAMSAIELALKNVSPGAHWITRCLATAGGKHIKMRLLGTADTVDTTPSARQQELYLYSVHRLASSQPTHPASAEPTRALTTSKNLRSSSFTSAPELATQRREAWLATHLLPAKSSLLPSEHSGIWLHTTGPFQGLQFLIGCNIRHPQAASPPAYLSEDSCVVLRVQALTSR
jgi:hypothetical protein